jgi:Fe2+ transport system protein FeoA
MVGIMRHLQLGFHQGASVRLEHVGNIQGIPRKIQGTLRECQGALREHLGIVHMMRHLQLGFHEGGRVRLEHALDAVVVETNQWTFSGHLVNNLWSFSEYSANIQQTFSKYSVNIQLTRSTQIYAFRRVTAGSTKASGNLRVKHTHTLLLYSYTFESKHFDWFFEAATL